VPTPPGLPSASGVRYRLRAGRYAAEVVQAGATLRTLTVDDRDLILPFPLDRVRPHMRGAVMVPWPGRIEDGRYTFDGEDHQLPLTEPASATAIHGLLSWAPFTAVDQGDDHVRLVALLLPQAGYPFALRCEVTYALSAAGLTVVIAATNVGARPAPYGAANHLYLVPGDGKVDDWTLTLDAGSFLTSPAPRFLPEGPFDVDGSDADFRTGRLIGDLKLNHSYTGLGTDEAGWAEARVSAADGNGVVLRCDAAARWLQVFSYDLPTDASRTGLAIEPMTCPPGSFNSGVDLVTLGPGDRHEITMSVAALDSSVPPASALSN
jgi:aldose 1-epimerase